MSWSRRSSPAACDWRRSTTPPSNATACRAERRMLRCPAQIHVREETCTVGLDAGERDALDEVALGEQKKHQHRRDHHRCGSHQQMLLRGVQPGELRQPQGQGELPRVVSARPTAVHQSPSLPGQDRPAAGLQEARAIRAAVNQRVSRLAAGLSITGLGPAAVPRGSACIGIRRRRARRRRGS